MVSVQPSSSTVLPPYASLCPSCSRSAFSTVVSLQVEWKVHLITPIHKSRDLANVYNCRPISLLSSISKVLERLIFNHILDFIPHSFPISNMASFRVDHVCNSYYLPSLPSATITLTTSKLTLSFLTLKRLLTVSHILRSSTSFITWASLETCCPGYNFTSLTDHK